MDASASTLAPEIGGVKLGCASNPMRVLNRLPSTLGKLHFEFRDKSHDNLLKIVDGSAKL